MFDIEDHHGAQEDVRNSEDENHHELSPLTLEQSNQCADALAVSVEPSRRKRCPRIVGFLEALMNRRQELLLAKRSFMAE